MTKEMNRDEILSLLKMNEYEQVNTLLKWKVLKFRASHYFPESLAECAFRLRNEVKEGFVMNLMKIAVIEHGENESFAPGVWFAKESEPIHWICAALLAGIKE